MNNVKKNADLALLRTLSLGFGPTGCEDEIRDLILHALRPLGFDMFIDTLGNLIVHARFGDGEENRTRFMVSAHMDEVGFMITDIDKDGYLRFDTVGGIDASVMAGRKITLGDEETRLCGVICSKAIHHKSKEERTKAVPVEKLYMDIGATSREEAEALVSIGTFGTFDSQFYTFGRDDRMVKSKALDDRMGCAALIEVLRALKENPPACDLDLFACFTVREEIGLSGAKTAAERIAPDFALVLETTAVGDVAEVAPSKRVASVGRGGALSLMDRATIYDRAFVDFLLATAKNKDIACQIKQFVSGGNDAGKIHKTGKGVRTAALSVPTRYLHSPACVASLDDYEAVRDLCEAAVRNLYKLSEETR